MQSCIKNEVNDISGNVILNQNFSIPLGEKEFKLDAPPVTDTSSIPGSCGTYYYNTLPYPCNFSSFPPLYNTANLKLSAKSNSSWIKKLTFSILTENSFPTHALLSVYLVDANGKVIDQVFGDDPLEISEANISSTGEVLGSALSDTIALYEGTRLELLKQTSYLNYKVIINSDPNITIRLSDKNKFKVTFGARVELEYNAKDLNK